MTEVRFGTDGIRGRVGEHPCTPEVGARVGRASVGLARRYGGRRVLVCRDTRPSGSALVAAVTSGITEIGGDALDAGILPTPGAAFALEAGLAEVAVVVTASHNPAADNGFKVLGGSGAKLDDAECALVESFLVEAPEPMGGSGLAWSVATEALSAYRDALSSATGSAVQRLSGRRVAFDLANGAMTVARPWIQSLPIEAVFVGDVGDGSGSINDGVGSEHLGSLAKTVVETGCCAGIAVDGDGDRCRLVDQNGGIVAGDAVAWLLATRTRARGLAVTVMSTGALEASLPGVRVVRTPVGDRHLREAMESHGLPLGVEDSGHVLFSDLCAGDGLVAGLRALSLAGPDLVAAVASFVPLPRTLLRLEVRRTVPLESLERLQAVIAARTPELGLGGRVFCRYSGTEPVLRILVEGHDPGVVDAVAEAVRNAAAQELG